jgi:PAS domain S-box-containing protein
MTTRETAQELAQLRLLYVEDGEQLREAMLRVFTPVFKEVVTAENGQEGLERFRESTPDLIITDLKMPVMDGLEMIAAIRKEDSRIPIVVISANDEVSYFVETIRLEVNGYLVKPMKFEDFLMTMQKVTSVMALRRKVAHKTHLMEQYQAATDQSFIVSKTNTEGIITYVNDAFCQTTGYHRDEVIGKTHHLISDPETPQAVFDAMWHTISVEKTIYQTMLKNRTKAGELYYSKITILPLLDEHGNIDEYLGLHTDVTEIMRPEHRLDDYLAHTEYPALILLKIESFNHLKHVFGDEAAAIIQKNFITDFDDDFKALSDNTHVFALDEGVVALAFECRSEEEGKASLRKRVETLQVKVYESSVNFGDLDYDVSIIVSMAAGDNALVNAKEGIETLERTGERFIWAEDTIETIREEARKNLDMLQTLKHAIDNGGIVTYFQPIVDNATQAIVKYETLVRLIDEAGNVISPFFFLEIAKSGKFYPKITELVIDQAFAMLCSCDMEVSINLSALDIERRESRERIIAHLERHRELAHRVVFELLEEEAVKNIGTIRDFISHVKAMGVQIAIDDFGSGYSNYQRLMDYQPDILKIDGSLIKNVHTDAYVHSVVTSLVAFAKDNGIKTVAEFVEDEAVYDCVNAIGIEFSQGYHFGKPEPLKACGIDAGNGAQ